MAASVRETTAVFLGGEHFQACGAGYGQRTWSAPDWSNNTMKGPKAGRYISLEILVQSRIRIAPAEPNPHTSAPAITTETLTA